MQRIITLSYVDGSFPFSLCVLGSNKRDHSDIIDAIRMTLRQEKFNDDSNYYIEIQRDKYDDYIVVVNTDEFIQPVAVFRASVSDIRTFA
jgi:hypothetical protein